jgi:subtilase family serine protease
VNDGAAAANATYGGIYVDVLDGAHFLAYNFTDALGVGESRTLANGFSTAGLSVGQHTLWIGADNFGQTAEGDENNNWRSVTFEVTAPQQASGGSLFMTGGATTTMASSGPFEGVLVPLSEWLVA